MNSPKSLGCLVTQNQTLSKLQFRVMCMFRWGIPELRSRRSGMSGDKNFLAVSRDQHSVVFFGLIRMGSEGAGMFAPPVGKAHTKATASPNAKLAPQRSMLAARPFGGGTPEQVHMLQRSIGNQATLRLLSQRGFSATWKEVGDHEQEAESASLTTQAAKSDPSWDLSKIPIFPTDKATRVPARPALSAPPLPGIVQPKLAVGRVDDPLEHEADRIAGQVMAMPDSDFSIAAVQPQVSRRCATCKDEENTLQTKRLGTPEAAANEAPGLVHDALRSPAQPLDDGVRAFFEPRFDTDLRHVRLHEGTIAARSAQAVGARAYTVGHDIVFADAIDTKSHRGRLLLAHELTHTVQQAGGATAGPKLQRQFPTPIEQEDMKDPDCPPEAPYRWGPKRGPGTADPAVVSPCMVTPMPHPQQNPLTPDQTTPQQAAPPEPAPAPAPTPTPEAPPGAAPQAPAPAPAALDQPAAETGDVDTRFEDDPLSEGGFGPDDATTRACLIELRFGLFEARAHSRSIWSADRAFRDDAAHRFRHDVAQGLAFVTSLTVDGQSFLACFARFRRRLSPVRSMRWALWTRRSRMASA
jgi:hypothetical protein